MSEGSTEEVREPVHNGEGMRGLHAPGGSDTWREPPLKLLIAVTAEDITNGDPGVPDDCPIALALMRDYGGVWDVSSGAAYPPRSAGYPPTTSWILGRHAIAFIRLFDSHNPVVPFVEEVTLYQGVA